MRGDPRARSLEHTVGYGLAAALLAAGLVWAAAAPGPASADARAAGAVSRPPLPEILTDTESSAEDIVDFALSGDRHVVILGAATLRASANGRAAAALVRSGVPASKVTQLRQRASRVARLAQRGSFVEIALAANRVSGLMPELYAHFRNRVPPLILMLDYLDREAELRSLERQPARVESAVIVLEHTWPRVRPKVIAAGGARESAAYDAHLRAMKRLPPGERRSIQAEAVRGLELVDELERVFTR